MSPDSFAFFALLSEFDIFAEAFGVRGGENSLENLSRAFFTNLQYWQFLF